ncbi:MAG: FMN-binding protein [Alphaproteobacteria bacterium]|nr:MAG: FMN-binding protein [Alphaproteobacteria bacterium]
MITRILVTLSIIIVIIANPFNLSSNESIVVKEESLTNKYINSLREGKWGASDPSWVKKEVAKEFFPKVTKLGRLEGDPPTVSVFSKGELVGYLFVTKDITSSKGYASLTFDMLVGLRLDGKLAGAKVLDHQEPIIGMYTPDGQLILPKFTSQYKDLDIRVPTKVNLLRTEGEGSIDGISSATVSAVLFNGAILRAARIVALSKGLRLNDKPVVDIVNFEKKKFYDLVSDGSISRLTLKLEDLKNLGVTKPKISNRSGVADIYRYRALFKGDTPVAAKQKEVKKGYKDTDRNLAIDLYLAPVVTPTIGRNLLGDKWYDIFVAGRDPEEMSIVITTLGRYALDGEPEIASGNFKRLAVIQNNERYPIEKSQFRNLGFLHGEDKPFFAEAGLYRIPAGNINPVEPWKLELLIESEIPSENKKIYVDYHLSNNYIIQPDGLKKIANKDEPIWFAAWESQRKNIIILSFSLLILSLSLIKMETLTFNNNFRQIFRNIYLLWILIWLGWEAGGQVTILSILTWVTAPISQPSWNTLLSDPLLIVLMSYVIVTFFVWGRGVFCGWLCPFGALQEIIANIGKFLKIKQIKIPEKYNKTSLNIKYIILLTLFITCFIAPNFLNLGSEIEPFKTAISMKFNREWYYVIYAILLLAVGLFIERFFCRFICPLGAFMAIGGKLRIFNSFLKRRNECGSPCKLCSNECPIDAIEKNGKINMNECFYCLDCQSLYYNDHKCPPLVIIRKKNAKITIDQPDTIKA